MTPNAFIERATLLFPQMQRREIKKVFELCPHKTKTEGLIPLCTSALRHAYEGMYNAINPRTTLTRNAHIAADLIMVLYILSERD
jgi:hypothetical protein